MKTSKRIISFVLCAIMFASCFFCTGKLPELEAKAASVGGFTQTKIGSDDKHPIASRDARYREYQKRFFLGEETNWPTNFVIPGLSSGENYTPQGMTYWAAKEWILISAYDASGSGRNSVVYALDVVSTNLVAVFKIENADGSANTSHGGGIAASEYNFYYADSDSKVSYVPLSEMDVAEGTSKNIRLRDSVDFAREMTGVETGQTVKTSYCCYDDGILWTGNFVWSGDDRYKAVYHATYQSILMGYQLAGNSSEEEWYYLKNGFNLIRLKTDDPSTVQTSGALSYRTYNTDGANVEIRGTVTTSSYLGEATSPSSKAEAVALFNATEGKKYKIEYISDYPSTDIYMWSSAGTHCNVGTHNRVDLGNGKYKFEVVFTAGLRPSTSNDSGWPTTQSTNGSYTGEYFFRFDIDGVQQTMNFNITDLSITEYVETSGFTPDSQYEGIGCAGNPTYVVAMDTDRIQYAMVDKGKLYVSRSWSRTASGNHTRELMIADIDLGRPGQTQYTVNGRTHNIYLVNYSDSTTTHFGGNYKSSDNGVSAEQLNQMLFMGEALCVIDDYLYMFGESAGYAYYGNGTNGGDSTDDNPKDSCPEPIDVIWKIDQYAIQGLTRPHEDVTSVEYEKVSSLSELSNQDEYIIFYESALKDPVSQKNYLYLLDSNGGYGDRRLPKVSSSSEATVAVTGDSRGIVGYEISNYSVTTTKNGKPGLVLSAEDDANKSLHWQFESGYSATSDTASLKLYNRDLYYAKHPYLYIGDSLLAMTTNASSTMQIKSWGNGEFTLYGNGTDYSIWCNDGSVPESITAYSAFYDNHNISGYVPNYHGLEEQAGTFHITNSNQPALPTGEQQGLQIYKRVTDPYASSYETQVYTDLQAKLTADGTYNITLETYATNNLQYQRVDAMRPTDFIFVLDSSGSLDAQDTSAYKTDSSWSALQIGQIVNENATKDGSVGINVIDDNSGSEKFYYQTSDGAYHPIYASVKTTAYKSGGIFGGNCEQSYWTYYINIYDGLRYLLKYDGTVSTTGWDYDQLVTNINNNTNYSGNADNTSNSTRRKCSVWGGKYFTYSSGHQRMDGIKNAVDSLTYKIAEQASKSGLDHRIALCSFGTDGSTTNGYQWEGTNLYTNSGSKISYPNITNANYQNAFFSVSQFGTLRSVVSGMNPLGHTYPSYGLDMASDIIDQQKTLGNTYDVNGNRSAVVIVISDGVTGWEEDDDRDLNVTKQVANDTLSGGAYSLKRNGAYIYSVLLGNDTHFSETEYDERDFMKYLSSEYTGSLSLTDPGPHNTKENVSYYKQIASGADFNLYDITDSVFNEVVANSQNAIASLTADSILCEEISDAFDLSNATITVQTAKSRYDGIGRLYFDEPKAASGITATPTTTESGTTQILVKGYDYSTKNVSEYNSVQKGQGEKLVVTISGVIANRDKELLNTSINVEDSTAIYQNQTYYVQDKPVKEFPTYHFSIPEYTYVLDYDLPMLDTDINGTLVSVDTAPDKQSTYVTNLQTDVLGVEFVDNAQNMLYSLNSQEGSTERNSRAYVLIKRDDGSYDWFRLNIIPASTVYFEDNKTKTLAGTESYADWTQNGSYAGKEQTAVSEGDVFGNDPLYSNSTDNFSLGTHLETTVTSSNNRSETKTFSFIGTGFDLVSACGPNTGIQTVVVKKVETDENGNKTAALKKVYIVDTYYGDTTYGTIYQAPIVHFEEDPNDANLDGSRNEYIVETTAAYYSFAGALAASQSVSTEALGETGIDAYTATAETSVTDDFFASIGMDELIGQDVELVWMDDDSVLNGGEGATETIVSTQADGLGTTTTTPAKSLVNYIDGFRIYNPLTDAEANTNYPENEKNATYYNLMSCLEKDSLMQGKDNIFAYIEGGAGSYSFGEYTGLKGKGPKNEVYLTPGDDGVSFKIKVSDFNAVSAKLGMRKISGNPKVVINGIEFPVSNTSEQYFDISGAIKKAQENEDTVAIKVTGSGLVALSNLRLNNATLKELEERDLANVARMMTMAATPVTYDPSKVYTPAPTFVTAPADDPNIDPVGRIPTLEEYLAINGITPPKDDSHIYSFADKIIAIIEKVIEFIKKVVALVVNTFSSMI